MAGDNVTVSIGADTSKLRADLALATAEVRKLKNEMAAAAKESLTTGDRSRVDVLAKQLDDATRSAAALNKELRTTGQVVAGPTWAAGARGVKALADEFKTLARTIVPFASAGGGILEFFNLIGKTKDELLALNRMSLTTGFSPTAIKAVNESLEDVGAEAGAADRTLMGLARAMAQVRQDARNSGEAIGSNVQVLRGVSSAADETRQRVQELMSGVNVGRGGIINKLEVKDAATAFAVLQVNMAKFKDTTEGNDAALEAVIQGFERLEKTGRTDLGNLVAQALNLGRSVREAIPALKELGGEGLRKAMQTLEDQGRAPTKEAIQNAKDYQKALKDVGDALNTAGFAALKTFGPEIQAQAKLLTNDINAINQAGKDMATAYDTYVGPILAKMWEAFVADLNRVAYAAKAAAAAIREVANPPAATAVIPPIADSNLSDLGFAAGGRVRGRGTGTSDSILARLSNGEFVVNAAATSRFLPLLRAINDGMRAPLMPRTSFAMGGLVMATDAATGTPVHLHIGGHSFPMRTDSIVAESLIRTAREKQLLSAGRKPSWAGGRRYGG